MSDLDSIVESAREEAACAGDVRAVDALRVRFLGKQGLITGQLNRERLSLVNHGMVHSLYQETAQWAAATPGADGDAVVFRGGITASPGAASGPVLRGGR